MKIHNINYLMLQHIKHLLYSPKIYYQFLIYFLYNMFLISYIFLFFYQQFEIFEIVFTVEIYFS